MPKKVQAQDELTQKPSPRLIHGKPADGQERHTPGWSKCAVFLRAETVCQQNSLQPPGSNSPPLGRPRKGYSGDETDSERTSDQVSSDLENPAWQTPQHNVTLICFGGPVQLRNQLKAISNIMDVKDLMQHPYVLWEVITYHLSMVLDFEMWGLTDVFDTEQRVRGPQNDIRLLGEG